MKTLPLFVYQLLNLGDIHEHRKIWFTELKAAREFEKNNPGFVIVKRKSNYHESYHAKVLKNEKKNKV